jgi:hypothetical protein
MRLRAAQHILRRELVEEDEQTPDSPIGFRSLFLSIAGLHAEGGQFSDVGYAASLEGLATLLDQMSERPVVPGRVFTPSTIHGISDLLFSWSVMLISTLPDGGDDGVVDKIGKMTEDPSVFPNGDRSVLGIVQFLRQMLEIIKPPYEKAVHALNAFSPRTEFFSRRDRFETIVTEALRTVEKHRTERVNRLPFDQERLTRLRHAAEAAILNRPALVSFKDSRYRKAKVSN